MIHIFEQDCLHAELDTKVKLNKKYILNYFAYMIEEYGEKIDIVKELDTPELRIMQAFNEDGESWKFIQTKTGAKK